MTYLSIVEKLSILFDTMMDFYFILVFSVLLLVFTFMYIAKKITVKKYSLLMLISFIVVFAISIVGNYEVLSNTFDNFTTIFFGNIYFPSIYVYIGVLIISFIAFIVSIFNVMLNKIYKIINSIMFVVNNVLFVVILNIIAKNKIDIFSVQSLYSNTSLVAILELSMGLFILWLLSLVTIYTTNLICINFANKKFKKKDVKQEVFSPVLEVSNDVNFDVNSLNNEAIESVYVENMDSVKSKEIAPLEEIKTIEMVSDINAQNMIVDNNDNEYTSNITFNDLLDGVVPVNYYENEYINTEYELVDPQNVYENNYNKAKDEATFNDILVENNIVEESIGSIQELTKMEIDKISAERLITNTISLNDLTIEDDNNIIEINNGVIDNNGYSVEDYKKIMKMLNEIKSHANGTNINLDDAVAIGLINNYSIDDCMKFKSILENNLN